MQTRDDEAVRVDGLGKTFRGGVRALESIGFTVATGALVALIGENGSGKSTLLKILFGVVAADEGEVQVLGCDPRTDQPRLRANSGFAEQRASLDPEMTGWEMLTLFYALHGLPPRDRALRLEAADEAYELNGFWRRRAGTYSGGQRQRLHLALATLHAPRLLLLDEPTLSLDPDGRKTFWSRLSRSRETGVTVLIATHDLREVAERCDKVLMLKDGELLVESSPRDLTATYSWARTVITLEQAPDGAQDLRLELKKLDGVHDVTFDDRVVTLWRTDHPDRGEPALDLLDRRGLTALGYEHRKPDLESAYYRLTGHQWTTPAMKPPSDSLESQP